MKDGFIFLIIALLSVVISFVIWFGVGKMFDINFNNNLSDFLFICFYLLIYCIFMKIWLRKR
jgi:hypothetical protein